MARKIPRSASFGNLLDADDGVVTTSSIDDEDEMKNSFLPGLLGKRKYAQNKIRNNVFDIYFSQFDIILFHAKLMYVLWGFFFGGGLGVDHYCISEVLRSYFSFFNHL